MKVKKEFMLREIAGNLVVVPVGQAAIEFNGIINLNEIGAFLWTQMINDTNLDLLVDSLLSTYETSFEIARKDVSEFIKKLEDANLLD